GAPKATMLAGWRKKRAFGSMTELMEFFRETGRKGGKIGGKIAAKNMTKSERVARAKKRLPCPRRFVRRKHESGARPQRGSENDGREEQSSYVHRRLCRRNGQKGLP